MVPNLTRGIELTGLNQLWVADVTYLRLKTPVRHARRSAEVVPTPVESWCAKAPRRPSCGDPDIGDRRPAQLELDVAGKTE